MAGSRLVEGHNEGSLPIKTEPVRERQDQEGRRGGTGKVFFFPIQFTVR
jgi:hypothetical protein